MELWMIFQNIAKNNPLSLIKEEVSSVAEKYQKMKA